MDLGRARRVGVAALLSALLPGLGQFYNRQWGKGTAFLLSVLVLFGSLIYRLGSMLGSADLDALERSAATGNLPEGIGQVFVLTLIILALIIWSMVDAARSARGKAVTPGATEQDSR